MATARPATPAIYPVNLGIDYPDRELNRLTSFFRIFTIIPIAVILGLLAKAVGGGWGWIMAAIATGSLFFPVLLMVLFRQKYPKWWYDWNLQLSRFSLRVTAYFLLLTDVYPSTDEEQSVHFDMPYPDAKTGINRWLPLVKWFLAIPHWIVLYFLSIAEFIMLVIAWFAILFTGRYPQSIFDFIVGVTRWEVRVIGYAFLLVTDEYPPFRFEV
jgi:hypothetical protein